jgi:phage-related protein
MAVTEDLIVKVQADTSKAVASLELMAGSLDAMQAELLKIGQSSSKAEKSITGFGGAVVKINQALELSKKVFNGLVGPVSKMVGDFLKAEDSSRQFAKTLSILGEKDVAGTVNRFKDLADQLEETTNVEAESILGLAKLGASAGLTNDQMEQFIRTSIDMAGALDTDVDSAFKMLLGSMKGQEKSLGPLANLVGDLTKAELEAGKAAEVLGAKLKGMGNVEGPLAKIQAIFRKIGDIGEEVGEIISKGLNIDASAQGLIDILNSIRIAISNIKPFAIEMVASVRGVFNGLSAAIKSVNLESLINQFLSLSIVLAKIAPLLAGIAFIMVGDAFMTFAATIGKQALMFLKLAGAQSLVLAKMALIAVAVATVVTALDFLIANSKKLEQAFMTAFGVIVTGFLTLFEKIFRGVGWDSMADKFAEQADKFAESAVEMSDGLETGAIIEGINQATIAVGAFKNGFDETIDSVKELPKELEVANGAGRKTANTLKTMSEEGKKTFDELIKKVGDLKKELADIGASEGTKIKNTLDARIQEIALIEQKLSKEGALSKAAQDQLKIARDTAAAIATAQAKDVGKKNLDQQIAGYKKVQSEIDAIDSTTMATIDRQKAADLEELALQREKLLLDKDMNAAALFALDASEEMIEKKAELLAMKAPDADFEAAQMAGANMGNQVAKAFQGPISGMLSGAGAFADAIQGLIDFVPQMLDKISGVFSSLTDLPGKILEGFGKLGDSILKFVSDFIPNIVNMIPKLIEKFVEFFSKLPDVVAELLANLPDMLLGLLDRLPEIVENFVQKLTESAPKIIVSLINFLVKKAPYIALELSKALAIEIPMAIINGILDAIKSLPKIFSNLGKGMIPKPGEIAKNFALGLKTVTKTLTGVASKLFAVMDLEDGAKAGGDKLAEFAKTAEDAVNDNIEKLGNGAGDAWKGLIDAWRWVYDNIILPIFNGLREVWLFVYNNLLKPIIEGIRQVWLFVYNTVILPFINLMKTVWEAMMGTLKAAWGIVEAIWQAMMNVLTSVWDTLMVVFQSVWNVVQSIWDAMMNIFTSAWDMVKGIWDTLMELFSGKINIFEAVFKIGGEILGHVTDVFKEVFGVIEVMFKGVADIFLSVFKTIQTYLQGAADVFMSVFKYIETVFNGLVSIGQKIWDGLAKGMEGIGGILTNAFSGLGGLVANAFSGVKDIFSRAFNELNPIAIFEKIFKVDTGAFGNTGTVEKTLGIDLPFMSFARGGKVPGNSMMPGDSLLNDKILALLSPGEVVIPRSVLADPVMKKLVESMLSGQKIPQFAGGGAIGKLGRDAKKTYDEKVAPVIEPVLEPIVQAVENIIPDLNPAQMWEQVKEMVGNAVLKIFESNKFHEGGEVPAMLKPGEFVMNNGAVDRVGTGFLNGLNQGGNPSQPSSINNVINLTINTTQPIDEAFIKAKIYPVVKDQIKRASIDGQTLVYSPGVRTA